MHVEPYDLNFELRKAEDIFHVWTLRFRVRAD